MLKKTFLIAFALCSTGFSFSQVKNKEGSPSPAKVLSGIDSIEVRNDFFAGLKEKTSGRSDQAEVYFKEVIKKDPANDAALYELSNLYRAQQKDDLAEEYAKRASDANPSNKWYLLLLSDIYKQRQKIDKLPAVLDNLIRIDPDSQIYYLDKANAYVLLKKTEEAQLTYQAIEKRFGASDDLETLKQRLIINQDDPLKAIASLKETIKKDPLNISNYLAISELYLKTNAKDKALTILKKAHEVDVQNPYVILLMADIYRSDGKDSEAFTELKKVVSDPAVDIDIKMQIILSYFPKLKNPTSLSEATTLALTTTKLHPADPKGFAIFGDLQAQSDNFAGAKSAYKEALKLNKNVFQVWEQLLQIETAEGDYSAVIKDGEEALVLFPERSPLYLFTGIANAGKNNHEKAIVNFHKAASIDSENAVYQSQVYASLANSLNSLKKYKESDAAFEKALQLDPINAFALNNYAYFLSLRVERLERAAEMSKQTNELQPENASFQDTYAWVLFKQKKYEDARIWMEKAIKNNKDNGVQLEHYGDILFHLKQEKQALEYWIKAKELGVKSAILDKKINEKKYTD